MIKHYRIVSATLADDELTYTGEPISAKVDTLEQCRLDLLNIFNAQEDKSLVHVEEDQLIIHSVPMVVVWVIPA